MNFKIYFFGIAWVFLILSPITIKAGINVGEQNSDEMTLRNQLFADVFLIKEGIDRVIISAEVLNKRFSSQLDSLKTVQSKAMMNDATEDENSFCDRITGMFNITFKTYNAFENHLTTKLKDIQEVQTIRLGEIASKQEKVYKNLGAKISLSGDLDELTTFATDINEKIKTFEQNFEQIQNLEVKLNKQKSEFNTFVESQVKILQQISDKLNKNNEVLEKYEKELPKL